MKKIIILSFLLLWIYNLNAQTFCFTPQNSSNIDAFSSLLKSANVAESYTLRIYIHVIRRTNGTGGQSEGEVDQAIGFLNSDFNPHGIYFQREGNIDYIDNDSYYSSPTTTIYTVNNHSDGIDIYIFDDTSAAGGRANGVGEFSEYWISGSYWDYPYGSLVKSHVISHEMGHVLFLWHTHHGTYYEGGDSYQCPELVDGSNSSTCGDYISDTPADPHLQFNVNYSTCSWNGSGIDANGDSYNPDETLIMAYSHPDCMSYFSDEQGERMRNAIATLSFLQQTVISCEETIVSNRTITTNETIEGCDVKVENVTIQNNSDVIIDATNNVTIEKNFEVRSGSTLEIK